MMNHIQKSDNASRPDLPLPVRPEQVTRSWLEAALAVDRPGLRLRAGEVVDVIRGTSTKIRVRIDPDPPHDLPTTLIVKGGFEDHSPLMAEMYLNELRF